MAINSSHYLLAINLREFCPTTYLPKMVGVPLQIFMRTEFAETSSQKLLGKHWREIRPGKTGVSFAPGVTGNKIGGHFVRGDTGKNMTADSSQELMNGNRFPGVTGAK